MRKGRTHRKRSVKEQKKISMENFDEIINLVKWIKNNGFEINKKIKLVEFSNTGRGVMALEYIDSGDTLMKVPFDLILSLNTLQSDCAFVSIFQENMTTMQHEYVHELIAFYICCLKLNISRSVFWNHYLLSLPKNITVPYYYSDKSVIEYLDKNIYDKIKCQASRIEKSYYKFKVLLENSSFKSSCDMFSFSLYEWAYFVVNTRSVYLDGEIVIKVMKNSLSSSSFNFLNHLVGVPNMGLIPYLDMYNHCCNVKTKISFHCESTLSDEKINGKGSNYFLKLVSLSRFKKFQQIYISYGQHCSAKLISEYGFMVPNNPLTTVPIDFEIICDTTKKVYSQAVDKKKYAFIKRNNLISDLYVDANGYSFNLQRILFICTSDDRNVWNSKIYSCDFSATELESIFKLGHLIVLRKQSNIKEKINKIEGLSSECDILKLFICLLREYVCIMENLLLIM